MATTRATHKAFGRVFPNNKLPGGPGGSGRPLPRFRRWWIMAVTAQQKATRTTFRGSLKNDSKASGSNVESAIVREKRSVTLEVLYQSSEIRSRELGRSDGIFVH